MYSNEYSIDNQKNITDMAREEFFKNMVKKVSDKGLLIFDEPKEVENLLVKIDSILDETDYSVKIKPNDKEHRTWEEIVVYVENVFNGKIELQILTDRTELIMRLKEVFASIVLNDLEHVS